MSQSTKPLTAGIRFPHRISAEHTTDLRTFGPQFTLRFHGSDGSQLAVVLSLEQVQALMGIKAIDPGKVARDLYVAGHIDVDEFERRLDVIEALMDWRSGTGL